MVFSTKLKIATVSSYLIHGNWMLVQENNLLKNINSLTLILLMWRIWWALNNASKGQKGFNWAFKGLMGIPLCIILCVVHDTELTDCVRGEEGKVGRVHTLEAYGGKRSTSCPSWNPSIYWIAGWVGPRAGPSILEMRKIILLWLELNPGSFILCLSHYTNWTLLAAHT